MQMKESHKATEDNGRNLNKFKEIKNIDDLIASKGMTKNSKINDK